MREGGSRGWRSKDASVSIRWALYKHAERVGQSDTLLLPGPRCPPPSSCGRRGGLHTGDRSGRAGGSLASRSTVAGGEARREGRRESGGEGASDPRGDPASTALSQDQGGVTLPQREGGGRRPLTWPSVASRGWAPDTSVRTHRRPSRRASCTPYSVPRPSSLTARPWDAGSWVAGVAPVDRAEGTRTRGADMVWCRGGGRGGRSCGHERGEERGDATSLKLHHQHHQHYQQKQHRHPALRYLPWLQGKRAMGSSSCVGEGTGPGLRAHMPLPPSFGAEASTLACQASKMPLGCVDWPRLRPNAGCARGVR